MAKINLKNLLQSIENPGRVNVVTVSDNIRQEAQLALDNMLRLKPVQW